MGLGCSPPNPSMEVEFEILSPQRHNLLDTSYHSHVIGTSKTTQVNCNQGVPIHDIP